jgi:hypothetical protein
MVLNDRLVVGVILMEAVRLTKNLVVVAITVRDVDWVEVYTEGRIKG